MRLLRDELKLAQAEMRRKGKQVGRTRLKKSMAPLPEAMNSDKDDISEAHR